jgi:hypothetical protein
MSQLAGYNTQQTVVNYAIQSGTVDSRIPIFIAPFGGATVLSATGFVDTAVGAHATNFLLGTVYNGGTAGSALTVVAAGPGTATGWSADVKTAYTLTAANVNLAAGEVLALAVDIAGSAGPVNFTTIVEWVRGQG